MKTATTKKTQRKPVSKPTNVQIDPTPIAPRTIPISEFKAKCLGLLAEVEATGRDLVVTKHGKALAKVSPVPKAHGQTLGCMKGLMEITGDIVNFSMADLWDCQKE